MKFQLQTTNHSRHLILYHLIFVAKYRRKIFSNKEFGEAIKKQMIDISNKYDFTIEKIDLDYSKPDHIHFLVRSSAKISPSQIVRVLKQEATVWAWNNYKEWLSNFLWKSQRHIFTRGFYIGTVGNVSADTVFDYLEEQGKNK